MREQTSDRLDLLNRPVYGMRQVDRVLALHAGTARRWIDGYVRGGRTYQPVVRLQQTGEEIVTWGEFSETRLLGEFRDAGVPIINLRPAVQRLRETFQVAYPLAHAAPLLETTGRELVLRVQNEVGLAAALQLVVVRSGQILLTPPVENYVNSAEFEPESGGIVSRLRPIAELDRVWLDPQRQFGEPSVRSVPTAVIAEQYRAGDPIAFIARNYDLNEEDVEQAIRYELHRANTSEAA